MFPDRMDKLVLDGVLNAHQYYNGYETEQVAAVDGTFEGFLAGCVAAPDNCALASGNKTVADLKVAMSDLFDTLKWNPIPFNGTIVDYSSVRTTIYSTLYVPPYWPRLSNCLNDLLNGDPAAFVQYAAERAAGEGEQDQAFSGIRCGDKSVRASSASELVPVYDELGRRSKWLGDAVSNMFQDCAQWRFQAKERYEGDFSNIRTKTPLLFIGNSFDPSTPLVSAQNMSTGFQDSIVLQHNGYGHLSLLQPSNCTKEVIGKYFVEGTLLEPGTVCEPNAPLFATAG
ncbi:hypothetical protein W97_00004 [Coniosporium apollinis CBS 100218]|uniref:Peptidase S33 tripeptidyl aminopeptidase-like C-terminal domain-containing protein n=1 Tax=Coniosporium apollinis (strain CBS 100218) TaxID=1168221 RepID=R7YFX7_CONA1|nr:uncharacterized protein W97_00004 [Coniosporium apollinis CBS 100218]EON60795.1 hypothetical protein W97_00004 [Coniosporium apollinis CBS 100218]